MPDDIVKSEHFVQFYENDAFLVDSVSQFIGAGLEAGHAGIVIATKAHREALAEELRARGLDLAEATARSQYLSLDAAQTLSSFMVDGWPEERRFTSLVGNLLARTEARFPQVHAFGEMVALLWLEGNEKAAVRLEQIWNNLAKNQSFSLFCAYPMNPCGREAESVYFRAVCNEHHRVIQQNAFGSPASL